MKSLEARLEELSKNGKITLSQALTLSKELGKLPVYRYENLLDRLEFGSISPEALIDELQGRGQSQKKENRENSDDQAFQDFTHRIKQFGRELGTELESLVGDFDKDRLKANMHSLFDDLSKTFGGSNNFERGRRVKGNYKQGDVTLLDQLHIEGNATMEHLNLQGALTVDGNLELTELKGVGQLKVQGNLNCKSLDFQGELFCGGELQIGTALNRGRIHCREDYSGADLDNQGTLNCQGNMQLIKLLNSGSLSADRSLKADRVDSSGPLNCMGIMKVSIADMEQCRVQLLEADQVHLGPKCRIEELSYSLECRVHHDAQVRNTRKRD